MQLNYCDLDFPLLVSGEISIIMNSNITDVEKNGRIELLFAVAYHTKNYHWKSILDFHSTCLLEIEKSERQWDQNDSYIPIAAKTLYNTVNSNQLKRFTKANNRPISSTKRWFCKPFQKNNNAIRGNHDAIIQGQSKHVEHICATCFLHDGSIAENPETSNDCPLKQNWNKGNIYQNYHHVNDKENVRLFDCRKKSKCVHIHAKSNCNKSMDRPFNASKKQVTQKDQVKNCEDSS